MKWGKSSQSHMLLLFISRFCAIYQMLYYARNTAELAVFLPSFVCHQRGRKMYCGSFWWYGNEILCPCVFMQIKAKILACDSFITLTRVSFFYTPWNVMIIDCIISITVADKKDFCLVLVVLCYARNSDKPIRLLGGGWDAVWRK